MPTDEHQQLLRRARAWALCGGGLWLALFAADGLDLASRLTLLGPLAAVPLALALCVPHFPRQARLPGRWRIAVLAYVAAALGVFASAWLPRGPLAGALSIPWALFTFGIALLGLLRIAETGVGRAAHWAIAGGMLFLPVGGFWLTCSRLGNGLFGFGEPIVTLTAAHFHFAGLVLPLITGLAAARLPGRLANFSVWGVLTGIPLVAVGITSAARGVGWIEPLAALWLTAACLIVAWQMLGLARATDSFVARGLWIAAAGALTLGMLLASTYGLSQFLAADWLDIPTMLSTHALLQVFGFSLCALAAAHVDASRSLNARADGRDSDAQDAAAPDPPELVFRLTWCEPEPSQQDFIRLAFRAANLYQPRPADARDTHRLTVAREPVGPPVAGGPFERVAEAIERFDIFPQATLVPIRNPAQPFQATEGDTIAARAPVVPGVEIVIASRVIECFNDRVRPQHHRRGFTYRTLPGHPFIGEETFAVEKDAATGDVTAVISSWSRPQCAAVRLLYPWVRRKQLQAARGALAHLAKIAAEAGEERPRRADGPTGDANESRVEGGGSRAREAAGSLIPPQP